MMVIQNFYPVFGGAERQALELSQVLLKKGIHVEILTRCLKNNPAKQIVFGLSVKRLFCLGKNSLNSLTFMFSTFLYLFRKKAHYQIIHAHLASSHALAAAFIGFLFKRKVLIKIGGGNTIGEILQSRATLFGRAKLSLFRVLKPILVIVNQDQRKELERSRLDKLSIHHIPNGVNLEHFSPVSEDTKQNIRDDLKWTGSIGLFAGRFHPNKIRQDVFENLLTAMEELKRAQSPFSLNLIGSGPLEKEYRKKVLDRNLSNHIYFLGPKDSILEYLQAADVLVLPSVTEGLSNVLLEAMACGLPILASNVSGIKDVVEDGKNGLLFNPFEAKDIAHKINNFLSDPKRIQSMSATSLDLVKKYSLQDVADRYIQLYAQEEKV